jgi:hypothetical protein
LRTYADKNTTAEWNFTQAKWIVSRKLYILYLVSFDSLEVYKLSLRILFFKTHRFRVEFWNILDFFEAPILLTNPQMVSTKAFLDRGILSNVRSIIEQKAQMRYSSGSNLHRALNFFTGNIILEKSANFNFKMPRIT